METIHTIIHAIVWGGKFFLEVIVLKMIIGHWLAERTEKFANHWFSTGERNIAIWTHYLERNQKKGHESKNILDCGQGRCQLFKQPIA